MKRRAEYVDFQERGLEFSKGDLVVPFGANYSEAGRVTDVFPGIGYVDVEFAGANERVPVEDLVKLDEETGVPNPPHTNSAPVTDMVRTALEAVKLAADQSYLSKVAVLESLQECPDKVATIGVSVATELWAAKDPGSIHLLLDKFSRFGAKTASVSCVQRTLQGRKPFVASEWVQTSDGRTWFRVLEGKLLRHLKVAKISFAKDQWHWSIGTKTASGFSELLEDATGEVDRRLASLGYALR